MALICFRLAHHADDARALPGRDLHRRLTDLAVDAEHQHRFAGLWNAGAAKALHGGDEGHADAGGPLPGHGLRLVHHRVRFDDEMAGVSAVTADAEVAGGAEHLAADRTRRPLDHHAGVIATRRPREDGIGHQPGRGLDVGRIDSGGLDLDQEIIRTTRERMTLDARCKRGGVLSLGIEAHAARFDGFGIGWW